MMFDVICPCLKSLWLTSQGPQWVNNCVCLHGSNFRIFVRFPFSVSYSLLFLPICLALFLSVVFFLSVACINKFPSLHLVHWFASTLLALCASGKSDSPRNIWSVNHSKWSRFSCWVRRTSNTSSLWPCRKTLFTEIAWISCGRLFARERCFNSREIQSDTSAQTILFWQKQSVVWASTREVSHAHVGKGAHSTNSQIWLN